MNAWKEFCNVEFSWSQSQGEVRISRGGDGYWSYLGTDILHIPAGQPTMTLQGFVMATPESEYKRVVRHETGHTLGFPHEHMRKQIIAKLDVQKTIAYFLKYQGWDEQTTREQVLTPLNETSIMGTPNADETSIMCYQLPASITKDGKPIVGGDDINDADKAFAAKLYPLPSGPPLHPLLRLEGGRTGWSSNSAGRSVTRRLWCDSWTGCGLMILSQGFPRSPWDTCYYCWPRSLSLFVGLAVVESEVNRKIIFAWLLFTGTAYAAPQEGLAAALTDARTLDKTTAYATRYLDLSSSPQKDFEFYSKVLTLHVNLLSREATLASATSTGKRPSPGHRLA
jgi:hypothetical protein